MIDKPAGHEADHTTLDTAVDILDSESIKAEKTTSGRARFALFLSALALLFTTIGVAAGYKHWQRMNTKAKENAAEIADLRDQLKEVPTSKSVDSLRKEVEEKTTQSQSEHTQALQEMARLENQTRQFADTVASQVEQITFLQARMQQAAAPATAKDWQIAEVEYLLQLASRDLHLTQSTQTAITALKEADGLLAKLGLVNYLPVRQQISRDVSKLEAIPIPDIAGISQRITALALSLKPLPALDAPDDKGQAVGLNENPDQSVEGNSLWADYKRKAINTLNEAIVIRQFDKPLQTELDADSRQRLFQLLKLRLENLRLLALQPDDSGFHAQLDLIKETVASYYPEQQAKPLLTKLEEFDKENLRPSLPDISDSLKQLDSARHAEAVKVQEAAEADKAEEDNKETEDNAEPDKAEKTGKTKETEGNTKADKTKGGKSE